MGSALSVGMSSLVLSVTVSAAGTSWQPAVGRDGAL